MPTAKKPSPVGVGGVNVSLLKAKALQILKDPKTHELVLQNKDKIADAINEWRQGWSQDEGPGLINRVNDKIAGRFGQRGLERRVANLRDAVSVLTQASNELAVSLRPVTTALDEVDQMLKVSARLTLRLRKKAHRRIDDVLDDLEKGLFDLTFQGSDEPNV